MRKNICLIIIFSFLLVGCDFGQKESNDYYGSIVSANDNAVATKSDSNNVDESKEPMLVEEQLDLLGEIAENTLQEVDEWDLPEYYCTITDLNQNNDLELVISACLGTGHYSYLSIYEIDSEDKKAKKIEAFDFHGESLTEKAPDVLLQETFKGIYNEEDASYNYYIDDIVRDGPIIRSDTLVELSFGNNYSIRNVLNVEVEDALNGENIVYYDDTATEISEDDYRKKLNGIEADYNIEYKVNWVRLNELNSSIEIRRKNLLELYESQMFVLEK